MTKLSSFICLSILAVNSSLFCLPHKGEPAPQVSFTDCHKRQVRIADFKGKKLALVFIPSTSKLSFYCKDQSRRINARLDDLGDYNINVLCVTGDSLEKILEFVEKNELSFPLVHADKDTINAYGVDGWTGLKRYTFLINEEGMITKVITKVDIDNHAEQIINGFGDVY